MKRIAIIGAGISGLTAGYELKKAGFDVTVYEKEALVGGRMSTRVIEGFHFDIGADHLWDRPTATGGEDQPDGETRGRQAVPKGPGEAESYAGR